MMTLSEIRTQIDQIDCEIKRLFLERMKCAELVAQTKAESGSDVFMPQREAEIIEKRTADIDGELKANYTDFLTALIRVSRKYQYGILKKMQEEVLQTLLDRAKLSAEQEHSAVRVAFRCPEEGGGLNACLHMISLNGITIKKMEVSLCNGIQFVEVTLKGELKAEGMRRLICQLGKEAPDFEILSLEK